MTQTTMRFAARNAVIPQVLKERLHWCRWFKGTRDKMPANLDNSAMKWSNRANWLAFEQVQPFDKIGWFFTVEAGILGIDFDGCRDPQTGIIDPLVLKWIEAAQSYAEVSPSKTGVKLFVKGTIPDNHAIKNTTVTWGAVGHTGIEIYAEGRFFTVTGDKVAGCPSQINEAPEVLNDLLVHFAPAPKRAKQPQGPTENKKTDNGWDFQEWATWVHRNLDAAEDLPDKSIIITCPWVDEHSTPGDTARIWYGPPHTFNCFHAHCADRRWEDVHEKIEPGYKDKWQEFRPGTPPHGNGNGNGNGHHDANEPPSDETKKNLPVIILGGQLRNVTRKAVEALKLAQQDDSTIFVRSARLVKIARNEKKRSIIIQMGVHEVKNALTNSADFFRLKEKGGEQVEVPVSPPKEIAEDILASNPADWPFSPIEAIVETPVLRPDFSILEEPGYDSATHLYYSPQECVAFPKVPEFPTEEDVKQAVAKLDEVFGEFPYASKADKANTYAAAMTPTLRPAIKRHIPLGLFDAPKAGTGKGLAVDCISTIHTGKGASILTAPDNEDEWDKRITAMLAEGRTMICIDNIAEKLESAALDATLTADEKEGRILGQSRMIQVPNRATWFATGNNIKIGGDLGRRCYRIRLDPHVSRPWMRTGFKHEDLAAWVTEHRGEIISAILTLARAWFIAGKPLDEKTPSLGTFTDWAKMIGGILKFAGVEGFLGNLEKLYEEADEGSTQWGDFLEAWYRLYKDEWVTSRKLVGEITREGEDNTLSDALPEGLQTALKDKPNSFAITLGKALEKQVDTCYGEANWRIERKKDTHTKGKLWRIADSATATHNYPQNDPASEATSQNVADSADSATTQARSKKTALEAAPKCDTEYKHSGDTEHYPHYPQDNHNGHHKNGHNGSISQTTLDVHFVPLADSVKPLSATSPFPDRACYVCRQRAWRWKRNQCEIECGNCADAVVEDPK